MEPKIRSFVPHDENNFQNMIDGLQKQSFIIRDFVIDTTEFGEHLKIADYSNKYPQYTHIRRNFLEKALEHYVSTKLLDLKNPMSILILQAVILPFGISITGFIGVLHSGRTWSLVVLMGIQ